MRRSRTTFGNNIKKDERRDYVIDCGSSAINAGHQDNRDYDYQTSDGAGTIILFSNTKGSVSAIEL